MCSENPSQGQSSQQLLLVGGVNIDYLISGRLGSQSAG